MLFNTIDFVFFLPIVIIGYYLIHPRSRWVLLLAASYYFYMCWKVDYVLLIIASTIIDYFAGIQMGKRERKRSRIPFLILSLVTNLGLLFTFKYFNFFSESLEVVFKWFDATWELPMMDLLLPVGISFYTFQTLSYSIDVYQGTQKAEKHLGYFALYVSFFPQLVAGPIERYSKLTPQLKTPQVLSYENIVLGLRLILFGLFAKMVIADNLAPVVDAVYAAPEAFSKSTVLSAMFFYSFQIYCDFFGYSLIAIGSAKMMGINIMDNFKTPYLSASISEFWQRWHISLSTWFRDYLYFPLGGNRVKLLRWILNISVVFIVSGLWHGANWTFVIWGAIFGVTYLTENGIMHFYKKQGVLRRIIGVVLTFLIVTIAWVFFRSPSLEEAIQMFTSLVSPTATVETHDTISFAWMLLLIFVVLDYCLRRC